MKKRKSTLRGRKGIEDERDARKEGDSQSRVARDKVIRTCGG